MMISIAMATFNGAKYLKDQLESFVNQSRNPDEVIICDDCSTDETLAIIERFKKVAPFDVTIVKNEKNLGYTKNFEKAISLCSGDLIFFSDQDDYWNVDKIEVIEKVFINHPDKLLVIHDGELVDEALISFGATKLRQIMSGYGSDKLFITGALSAIHKDILPYVLPIPDDITGHDKWIHDIAYILNTRLVLNKTLQILRRHSSNTSEWIASSIKPINRVSVAISQHKSGTANSYDSLINYNIKLVSRLKSIELATEDHKISTLINKSYSGLLAEQNALIHRQDLIQRGFFCRKLKAIQMLFHSEYQYFSGISSFLRDFTR